MKSNTVRNPTPNAQRPSTSAISRTQASNNLANGQTSMGTLVSSRSQASGFGAEDSKKTLTLATQKKIAQRLQQQQQ